MGVKTDYKGIIILELFPHCNFSCDFCYQNSNERTKYFNDNYKLHEKSKIYYMKLFLEKYKSYNLQNIDYCDLWGGELFYDNSKEYNDLMLEIIHTINPKIKFGVTTNLSNINPSLYSLLFDKQPFTVEIGASYDAIGRFHNKEMLENYLYNVDIVKQSPNLANGKMLVETVLTPEMLDDRYDFTIFDKLYADEKIDNCLLIDFRGYPEYILENFGERVLKLLKRYPKLDNAHNFLAFSGYIKDDEITPCTGSIKDKGCYCEKETTHYFSYVTKFDMTDNYCSSCKKGDINKVIESFGCNNCQYNSICSDICSGSLLNSGLVNLKNKCPYKYIYDHVTELKKAYLKTLDKKELMKFLEK